MTRLDKRYASRLLGALPVAFMLPIFQPAIGQVPKHMMPKPPRMRHTVTLTEAADGHAVSLHSGDTLIVRLPAHMDGDYLWNVVWAASQDRLTLQSDSYEPAHLKPGMVGGVGTRTFRFTVKPMDHSKLAEWLRFVELRPFEKGINEANRFQVHINISR